MKLTAYTLSEVCEGIFDCPHTTARDEGEGYPLIRTPNVGRGRLTLEGVHRVSQEVYDRRNARAIPRPGDLIFAREAPAGNVALIQEGEEVCLGQRTVLIRPNKEVVNAAFLVYYLLSPEAQFRLMGRANGATVAHVNLPIIRHLKVDLPPIEIQERIADILSHCDSLIENNRRQIKLLEEAAQRLYKEWFVDLRFPGHDQTSIVNGIPQGWKRHILADLIQKEIGGGWGKAREEGRYDVPAYVIRGTDIEHVSVGEYSVPYRYHTRTNFDVRKLRKGDIIFEVSGGGKNEGVAKTLRVTSGMLGKWKERAICASFCKLVRLQDDVHSCYISAALKYLRATKQTESYENRSASSIINFRWADFLNNQEFIIPEKSTMRQYYEMSNAFYERQVALAKSISYATEARDRLLPKLMSGEVEV